MNDYSGKVVVITGAANGIGKELARQFAAKGAKLSLADIDAENLALVARNLQGQGYQVVTDVFDVAEPDAMEAFAKKTYEAYGTVDLFFNNAGVMPPGNILEEPTLDWDWAHKVDVMGLVHGIKAFVPAMIKQDKECYILNTASIAGMLTPDISPVYVATKHAALGLTEVLNLQLIRAGVKVKAYVVCPAFVITDLHHCFNHRPAELFDADDPYYKSLDWKGRMAITDQLVLSGIPVETAVERIIAEFEKDHFYIFTHPDFMPLVEGKFKGILENVRPQPRY